MKNHYNFYVLLVIALMLANCQKEEGPQVDVSPPLIDIVEPTNVTNYVAGSNLELIVNIDENQELHEFSVVLRNADRTYAQTLAGGHLHATTYRIEETFTLPDLADQVYTLTVKASDHNENLASASVELVVK
ncbi:hypothetical protein [Lewinella cohaerens]|uniref:hypothetical protein n=1 Tax=Lewinella cohaerens TaxID=70995 RepID=UPI00037593E0|nr:hypothetical protein [Lewinella cohaerens]